MPAHGRWSTDAHSDAEAGPYSNARFNSHFGGLSRFETVHRLRARHAKALFESAPERSLAASTLTLP